MNQVIFLWLVVAKGTALILRATNSHPHVTTAAHPACTDKLTDCEKYGRDSCTGIFASWAMDNCKHYCGLCDDKVTQEGCHDIKPGLCQDIKDIVCTNVAHRDLSLQNCKKTCGTCSENGVTVAQKGCQYSDGVTHAHGTYWIDGCSSDGKNCTCIDGHVLCFRLCPISKDPKAWREVQVPGKCCPKYVRIEGPKCNYKNGKSYYQDEIWNDGCKFKCQCTDSNAGIYRCRDRCPNWQLPPVCHWVDPKPGKCCHQPVCPPELYMSSYPDE